MDKGLYPSINKNCMPVGNSVAACTNLSATLLRIFEQSGYLNGSVG